MTQEEFYKENIGRISEAWIKSNHHYNNSTNCQVKIATKIILILEELWKQLPEDVKDK